MEFKIEGLSLRQDKCAMKIGTDGVLLGRWANATLSDADANGGRNILDIGTGTGLLALLLAVRYPEAKITAIDIDKGAYEQAKDNIERNELQQRVVAKHCALQDFLNESEAAAYQMIICNPPYFQNALKCPDAQRSLARHTDSLSFQELFHAAATLLTASGTISLIIPAEAKGDVDYAAALAGLFPSRICSVKTTPRKPVRRYLLEFSKQPITIETTEITINK